MAGDVNRRLEGNFSADRQMVKEDQRRVKRKEQRAELAARFFRRIGYVSRIVAYLVLLGFIYHLTPRIDLSSRPLGTLTLSKVGMLVGSVCLLIIWFRLLVNHDEEIIDWEAWGKFGLAAVGIGIVAALWLAHTIANLDS
jgi:hypothetical protein